MLRPLLLQSLIVLFVSSSIGCVHNKPAPQSPAGELVPDLSFGEDVGAYVNLGATDYDVQIKAQTGEAVIEFDANLTGLADSAVIVMATGYLDPSTAVGTEPFGLLAILPDGTVLPLSSQAITPARLQVIHNCAATDAATVDVWLNDGAMPLLVCCC